MTLSFEESSNKFKYLMDSIEDKYKDKIVKDANLLADNIGDPGKKDAQVWWNKLWEKPLFSGVKEKSAIRWKTACEPYLGTHRAWEYILNHRDEFEVIMDKSKTPEFVARGEIVKKIRESNVPLHRIYSIINSANLVSAWEKEGCLPVNNLSQINSTNIEKIVEKLGYGWGHITILHFLTDFGLTCKPDIHLNNTCKYLGMDIRNPKNPSLKEALAIVQFVRRLVESRWGVVTPRNLRYTDRCLMQASVFDDLISNASTTKSETPWYASTNYQKWLRVSGVEHSSENVSCRWEVDGEVILKCNTKSAEYRLKSDLKIIRGISKDRVTKYISKGDRLKSYKILSEVKEKGFMLNFIVG